MKYKEALLLKKGDLLVVDDRNKYYKGLVLEIDEIFDDDNWCRRVTLKQPGFNNGFRLEKYDTRHLKRYES